VKYPQQLPAFIENTNQMGLWYTLVFAILVCVRGLVGATLVDKADGEASKWPFSMDTENKH
jgi:hypothetical protein